MKKINVVLKTMMNGARLGLLMTITAITFWGAPALAAPMDGYVSTFTQPDGTVITLQFFGDEFYARTETEDGYTVVFDPDTKSYYYAALSPDNNELVSTGVLVGKVAPTSLGLAKKLEINPASRAAKVRKNFEAHEAIVQQEARWKALKEASRKYQDFKRKVKEQEKLGKKGFVIPMGTLFPDTEIPAEPFAVEPADGGVVTTEEPPIAPAPPSFTLAGDVVGLMLLVDFSDCPGTVVTQAQIDDYCNKPNYTGFSNAGSVYDYFFVQSTGKLRYNNNVTYYVRLPKPKTYYNDITLNAGTCGSRVLNDALTILIAAGYDFSKLSTKLVSTQNRVRACNVFFAGANSGVWAKGLWPHRSSITAKLVGTNRYIADYQITEIGTTANLKIGTVCHENGHMLLGYPDLYSYNGNAANIGNFSLMAGGNYGDGGKHPTHVDAYIRRASGWMDVVELDSSSLQRCTVQVDGNLLYRYLNPALPTEYFAFEVRHNTGYEGIYGGSAVSVNPTAGLVAYHAYETGSNPYSSIFTALTPTNSYVKPYELLLLEANPPANIPWYDNPTPDTSDGLKSSGKSHLSDNTTPVDLKFWVATQTDGGRLTPSSCVITNISAASSNMTFVVGTGDLSATPGIVLSRSTLNSYCNYGNTAAPQKFTVCNGQGGTLQYTISDDQDWLSCSPTNGTATTESDTIGITFSTSGLAAGIYSATITVTDAGASPSSGTITVSLTVTPQPTLAATPAALAPFGTTGLTGPVTSFALNNTGGGTCTYTLSKTQSWITLSPTNGTLTAETDTLYASLNAIGLAPGIYNDTITVTSPEASNSPLTIPVSFTVQNADIIVTSPNGGETWTWGTTQTVTWASSLGGNVMIELLKDGSFDSVIAEITPNDGSFAWTVPSGIIPAADYSVRVTYSEEPSKTDTSNAAFSIINPPIYFTDLETDPGFTRTGKWQWGRPGGNNVPAASYSGTKIYDTELSNTCSTAGSLTSIPVNCSNYTNVQLEFYSCIYITTNYTATFEVSNDETNWTLLYCKTGNTSTSWAKRLYDISAVADGASTVYVRWSMTGSGAQSTGGGLALDNIKLTGVYISPDPQIDVRRDGASIPNGSVQGINGSCPGVAEQLTYTISNVGRSALGLTTPVTISGQNNCSVTVDTQPSSTVSGGESTSLVLSVTPTAGGSWSFGISIANTDGEDNPYTWTVVGMASGSYTTVTTNFTAVADTYIDQNKPTSNYGTLDMFSLSDRTDYLRYGFVRFNLSSIPVGTLIGSATLDFIQQNSRAGSVYIYAATGTWTEAGATWNNSSNLVASTLFGSAIAPENAGAAVPSITLEASGLSKVQSWVDTPSENFGFGIKTDNIKVKQSVDLCSREGVTTNTYPPTLTLEYTAGEAPTMAPLMTVTHGGVYVASSGTDVVSEIEASLGTQLIYMIGNLGNTNLTLTTPVTVSGQTNCSIVVDAQPSSPIAPSVSTHLLLTVTPAAAGAWSATVSITNNTAGSPYTWTISGTAFGRYPVTYQANNAESGSVPTDSASPYLEGATVTVLGNTGSLARNGFSFDGWNTQADGQGADYAVGATFAMPAADMTLYAKWNSLPVVNAGTNQTVYLDQGQPWTPAAITTASWYDAADAATLTAVAGNVSQWDDKSGNNRHATQAGTTNKPTYQAIDPLMNNLPSIGTTANAGKIGLTTPSFSAKRVYVVAYYKDGVDSTFDNYATLLSGPGSFGAYRIMGAANSPFFFGTSHFNDAGTHKNGATVSSTNALPLGASLFKFDSSTIRTQLFNLGFNSQVADRDWNGAYSEWVFTDGSEDLATQQKIEGYLAHKWSLAAALPAGHPYKDAAPVASSATATLDGSVSDPENDPLPVQWSKQDGPVAPVTFADAAVTNTTATFTAEGVYTLRLTANDTFGSSFDECVITVNMLYNLVYNGNTAESGEVPLDSSSPYVSGAGVTVLGNTGGLTKTGYTFTAWNTVAAGTGVSYSPDDTFAIASNTTLYAQWTFTGKLPATVTLENLSQVYNGTARLVTATTDPTGLVVNVTYNGDVVAPTNVGSYAVTGTVASAGYEGWTNGTLVVSQAIPTVTAWPTGTAITVGQALSASTLTNGNASVPGTFTFDAPFFVPDVGIYTAAVTFAATDSVNYQNVPGTVALTVNPLPPPTPTGTAAMTPAPGQASLTWSLTMGATGYNVKRAATAGGPFTTVASITDTNYLDTTVSNGTTYYYVISALNDGGESDDSEEVSVTLLHVLPFNENFEALDVGLLHGQNNWTAMDTVVQTNIAKGAQAASITSEIGYLRQSFAGVQTNTWADFVLQPVFFESAPDLPDPQATIFLCFNASGNPVVYDGQTNRTFSAITVTTGSWVRVTVKSDYVNKTWDLYINTVLAGAGLGFYNPASTHFQEFRVKNAGEATSVALDDLTIGLLPPWPGKGTVIKFHF